MKENTMKRPSAWLVVIAVLCLTPVAFDFQPAHAGLATLKEISGTVGNMDARSFQLTDVEGNVWEIKKVVLNKKAKNFELRPGRFLKVRARAQNIRLVRQGAPATRPDLSKKS